MTSWLQSFTDSFIPDQVLNSSNNLKKKKAKVIVHLLLTINLITVLTYLGGNVVGSYSFNSVLVGGLLSILCLLFFSACLLYFKFTANYVATAHSIAFVGYLGVLSSIYMGGGLHDSPSSILIILVPMSVESVSTWRASRIWWAVIMLTIAGMHVSEISGFKFDQRYTVEHNQHMLAVYYLMTIFFSGLFLYINSTYYSDTNNFDPSDEGNIISVTFDALEENAKFSKTLTNEINYAALNDKKASLILIKFVGPDETATSTMIEEQLKSQMRSSDAIFKVGGEHYLAVLGRLEKEANIQQRLSDLYNTINGFVPTVDQPSPKNIYIGAVLLYGFEDNLGKIVDVAKQNLIETEASNQTLTVTEIEIEA